MALIETLLSEIPDAHISRIDEALSGVERRIGTPLCYTSALVTAERQASDAGDPDLARTLDFAARLFTIEVAPDKERRATPGLMRTYTDVADAEIPLIERLAEGLTHPDGRARMAHILWLRTKNFRMAEEAVDAYLRSGSDVERPDEWPACIDRYAAAVHLAASLRKERALYEKVIGRLREALARRSESDDSFLSCRLMELLYEQGRAELQLFVETAERIAQRVEASGNHHMAREYRHLKVAMERARDPGAAKVAEREIADVYEREARGCADKGNFVTAVHHLHCAVGYLEKHGGHAERVSQLRQLLGEYGPRAVGEMKPISVPLGVGDLIESTRVAISGKSLCEALFSLATISRPIRVATLRKQVTDGIKRFPLQHLFGVTVLGDSGTVVARRAGLDPTEPELNEDALTGEMIQELRVHRAVAWSGYIEPGRHYVVTEHALGVRELLPYLHASPFVPAGREGLFARGLMAGFEGDLVVASHLLIPQIENSIRQILLQRGDVNPVKVTAAGIDEQKTFSALLALPETGETFGADLVFSLRAVLDHRLGPNLRNGLAHGLLPPGAFMTPDAGYVWWLVLHLCLVPLLRGCAAVVAEAPGEGKVTARAEEDGSGI